MLDKAAPDFTLPATGGKLFQLSAERGHPLFCRERGRDDLAAVAADHLEALATV